MLCFWWNMDDVIHFELLETNQRVIIAFFTANSFSGCIEFYFESDRPLGVGIMSFSCMTMEDHMSHSRLRKRLQSLDRKFLSIHHTHQILHRQIITYFDSFQIICVTNNTKTSTQYNPILSLFSNRDWLISTNVKLNNC